MKAISAPLRLTKSENPESNESLDENGVRRIIGRGNPG
jgi:hypothetical protein